MRRLNYSNNNRPFISMSNTTKRLVWAVIIIFIVCNSGVGTGIINGISMVISYYMIAMIVLIVMMYFHHADNKVGRFLFMLMSPIFSFVSHFNPIKNSIWSTPIISVILVALAQNLIQSL